MDIRNLKAFIVLAETLNYHKASQILHISQPALTKKVNALEAEFGALLFSRGPGGTRLTDFGQKTFENAQKLLGHFEQFQIQVNHDLQDDAPHYLYVSSCFPIYDSGKMEERIFLGRKEKAVLVLITGLTFEQQMNLLNSGLLHIAIVPLPLTSSLMPRKIFTEKLVYLFKKGSDWFRHFTALSAEMASLYQLIDMDENDIPIDFTDGINAFSIYDNSMNLMLKTNDIMVMIELIIKRNGFSLVPEKVIRSIPSQYLDLLEVLKTDMEIDFGILWSPVIDYELINEAELLSSLIDNV
ncbi:MULTISPECIES: LysR family transcriptional regulator [Photorhabdus]|uniref:LysR family transcriptional regulator n=1 Tax=Photorhabdus TaxID=29487 RepID=UPI000DCE8322|nr:MULTISPECIES: LysR family transcriptional regulator [Photorhabdus]MCT8344807.1 LysR family transcriptional regulator [Photorhabdus kleinii]RAW94266.1 LysR family transcriptional regulator [Photorhabdus sp. S9-53]RAW94414.1 LysR family transcriptional regulator [Photorhabdus sp. S10-54]RAW98181.1 LysR family transcriptional regulator [Photorhabdus sp. S8-52]